MRTAKLHPTICHEKPTGVPLTGGHRWRVRAGFAARSAGLAAGRHPAVGVRMAVGGDLDPIDELAQELLDGVGVAFSENPAVSAVT